MADNPGDDLTPIDNEDIEETPGYQPPAQKSLKEIQDQDQDDESLQKYKAQLLAGAGDVIGRKFPIFTFFRFKQYQ